jgi:hypothetical protein
VLKYSKRDQLSWNVCAWFHRFFFRSLDVDLMNNNLISWPVVSGGIRLPRDFEDERYRSLHPDVRAPRVNPRQHFLACGMVEGRRYK